MCKRWKAGSATGPTKSQNEIFVKSTNDELNMNKQFNLKLEGDEMVDEKTQPVKKKSTLAKPKTAAVEAGAVTKKKVAVKPKVGDEIVAAKKTKATVAKKVSAESKLDKAVKATPAKPRVTKKKPALPTPEERYRMVEMAAYFIAEKHGFHGRSDAHWATAEKEIAEKLGEK